MNSLPYELVFELSCILTLKGAYRLSQCCKDYNELICSNDAFWKRRFLTIHSDYSGELRYSQSWSNLVRHCIGLWIPNYNKCGKPIIDCNVRFKFIADFRLLGTQDSWKHKLDEYQNARIKRAVFDGHNAACTDGYNNLYLMTRKLPLVFSDYLMDYIKVKQFTLNGDKTLGITMDGCFFYIDDEGKIVVYKNKILDVSTERERIFVQHTQTHIRIYNYQNISRSISAISEIRLSVNIKQISSGSEHTVILDEEGNVWTTGNNKYGQLGHVNVKRLPLPVKLDFHCKIIQISAGDYYTALIDEDHNLWTFGNNSHGQLGFDDDVQIPRVVPDLKVKFVTTGELNTLAIDLNDNVWVLGGDIVSRRQQFVIDGIPTPIKVANLKGVKIGNDMAIAVLK